MSPVIEGTGTPEAHWRTWLSWRDWPELRVRAMATGRPVLAVGAHPDDEVLGAGGLLAMLAATGTPISIIRATDGEASHPDADVSPDQLAACRRAESVRALAELGIAAACEHRLALPDGDLAARADSLRTRLDRDVQTGGLVLAPLSTDGHPDHEICGALAAEMATERGACLLEYPIWAWHWAVPADQRLPWRRASRVTLSDAAAGAKRAALDRFTSQVRPLGPHPAQQAVLPPAVLAHFLRSEEILFGQVNRT